MMKNKQSLYIGIGFLVIGLFLGGVASRWFFSGGSNTTEMENSKPAEATEHIHEAGDVWTCSMHPQIRKEEPGPCPICGMDLVPVDAVNALANEEDEVQMTSTAMHLANVQTATVERTEPVKEIYLSGTVEADERNIAQITARFAGRIDKLYVNVTGQAVKRGQALANVYSPELVTAQKELFEAATFRDTNPSFYEAAVNKLKLWNLSERQIQDILKSKEVHYNFNILAPQSGTVVARHVSVGDYISEGQSLFEVANLDQVWVVFDAYERDLPWIREGNEITFTVQSLPGQTFTSEITFIDPVIDAQKRVATVRTEVANRHDKLKPQMFAQGVLTSELPGVDDALVIPKSAVLWTGKRAIVYVKQPDVEQPTFAYREITLGPEAGDHYVVSEGLTEGERVVANGVFKVDAAAQLRGNVSMMSPRPDGPRPDGPRLDSPRDEALEATSEPINRTEIDPTFTKQLATVLSPYYDLKNALVASDAERAAKAAKLVQRSLTKVDMTLVEGEAQQRWTKFLDAIQEALGTIESTTSLDLQRTAFDPLSRALYQSIQQFGVAGLDAYYQYCPMADSNEGAYWLSETEEINNPYFGEAMLGCGETREELR